MSSRHMFYILSNTVNCTTFMFNTIPTFPTLSQLTFLALSSAKPVNPFLPPQTTPCSHCSHSTRTRLFQKKLSRISQTLCLWVKAEKTEVFSLSSTFSMSSPTRPFSWFQHKKIPQTLLFLKIHFKKIGWCLDTVVCGERNKLKHTGFIFKCTRSVWCNPSTIKVLSISLAFFMVGLSGGCSYYSCYSDHFFFS